MKFRKKIITLLSAALVSTSITTSASSIVSADTITDNSTTATETTTVKKLINGLIHSRQTINMVYVQCQMPKYSE